jgi:ABC-type Fe3+ transport system permease subunit
MCCNFKLFLSVLGQRISLHRLRNDNRGFGMNELLGIAAALIIAAFVIIPSLRTFAKSVMDGLSDWWTDTISSQMFPDV